MTYKKAYGQLKESLEEMCHYFYMNPELGNQEFKACQRHTEFLRNHGFQVEENFIGIATAFKAVFDTGKSGPVIGFLSEYDALPEIGHGCGHNMIGTISSGAAIIAKNLVGDLGGKIIVFGTPAEENDGAKVDMVEEGVFDTVDIVLMAHPSNQTVVEVECLAMEAIQYAYTGQAAHAAACPEKGVNALDGIIGLFNHINAMREHILPSARIHGIIKEGGIAANIVPERAVAQFYIRATTKAYLKILIEKVNNCAKASALATGTNLDISNYEKSYDNIGPAPILSDLVAENFAYMGIEDIKGGRGTLGSADAGNVSHVCPTVHAMYSIGGQELAGHTKGFADATLSPFAFEMMEKVVMAFAKTVLDLLTSPEKVKEIQIAYEEQRKKS